MTFLKYLNIAIVSLSGIATFNYAYNAIDNASVHKDTNQFNDPSKCENTSAYNSKLQTKLIWMLTVSSVLVVAGIVLIILKRHDAGRLYHVGWSLLGAGLIGIFWGVQEKYLETQTDNIMAVGCAIVFVVSLLLLLFVTGKGHGGDVAEKTESMRDEIAKLNDEYDKNDKIMKKCKNGTYDFGKCKKLGFETPQKPIFAPSSSLRTKSVEKKLIAEDEQMLDDFFLKTCKSSKDFMAENNDECSNLINKEKLQKRFDALKQKGGNNSPSFSEFF